MGKNFMVLTSLKQRLRHYAPVALCLLCLFAGSPLLAQSVPTPPGAKFGWLQVNGTDLFWMSIGEGVPVVILHGGPGLDHTYLLPQMLHLADKYKLIFFDQRGSGISSSIVDTNSMTMNTFVDDLEGVRKAFHLEKMNLIGHSWGGLLAMFYAVKYPDHPNTLTLMNSTPANSALRNASFAVMATRTSRDDSVAQAAIVGTEGFQKRDPRTMEEFYRLLFRGTFYNSRYADSLTLTLDSSYAIKSRLTKYLAKDAALRNYDLLPALKRVQCPTLIIGADYDMVTPEANEKLHEAIPGSTLVMLHHCGHFPFVEAPDQLFPVLEGFLSKTARR